MSGVRRVYVEKKPPYAVAAKQLKEDILGFLGVAGLEDVRILIRYDVENVSDDIFEEACRVVFSEPPVDVLYREEFPIPEGARVFSVEPLPGQFDQRADSAVQCVQFLSEKEEPVIRTAQTYVLTGEISDAEFEAVKGYCINPVDSRETGLKKPETLRDVFPQAPDVQILEGFRGMDEHAFRDLYDSLGLAMTYADFAFIRTYFENEEHRDPTITEIRVLDTYWSDHCRHTTFSTELKDVSFEDGFYRVPIETSYQSYLDTRAELYSGRDDKYVCLMDLALMGMKKLKADGKLTDMEDSEENNACSIVVPIEVDRGNGPETEEWLIFFKNETHNHPTEIEPFGGAATCLGGAIRDPLSGRGYVYQAMRVTGAADPTVPVSETMHGKLPQKKLVTGAAKGYSSYGNQIGLATGLVKEIYHPGYAAKRMEIGAVMGAAARENVKRESSEPGNIIILLGGRTGRDGMGGATGSSKAHTETSIETCGAEVQKGNAPTERKLQRLFRRPEAASLIRKCNDFGAGGVSVAIGELAPGLKVNLDLVPKKYEGLDGTELAISESQERMAVVIDPADRDEFMMYAHQENLEATEVAVVTEDPRLVLSWRGKEIVNISRAFLDTNGAHQETGVKVLMPDENASYFDRLAAPGVAEALKDAKDGNTRHGEAFPAAAAAALADLNSCSQKGLVEMFDASIGAGTVVMPYGGIRQLSETQTMIAKVPVQNGKTEAVTMMSYGFDPYLSSWSPYHGSVYAVTQSLAKIVAAGGDFRRTHLTFQEYFGRMSAKPERWSQPFTALLGAYDAQLGYGIASIGGKDSMSGTFNDLDVPPTLVSFAVGLGETGQVITPELKKAGNCLVQVWIDRDDFQMPLYDGVMDVYDKVIGLMRAGLVKSAAATDSYGVFPTAARMAFGNGLGICFDSSLRLRELFENGLGDLLLEIAPEDLEEARSRFEDNFRVIGQVTEGKDGFVYGGIAYPLEEAIRTWQKPLEKVFLTKGTDNTEKIETRLFDAGSIAVCSHKIGRPRVFIPVFPGTNCEYDTETAFRDAGAEVSTRVFRNLDAQDIRDSVQKFAQEIAQSQIVMFPGGFSAGDEPDGSAKFFATAFRDAAIREEITKLLNERDGLVLGICNGFQALIKLGLVPGGAVTGQNEDSPTLTYNTVGRHISKMVYTKVVSNKSPWLAGAELGGVYTNPASHGEGRFVAPQAWIDRLFENGQVATQYCDPEGNLSMDEEWNINGSFAAIEGITSPDGRVLGKMAHCERRGKGVNLNITGEQDLQIFASGVRYFL